MRVGFTGTREGLTEQQKDALKVWLWNDDIPPLRFLHGCCVGADAQAVDIVGQSLFYDRVIWAYPSNLLKLTDELAWAASDTVFFPRDPLVRNKLIVDGSDVLLACPKGPEEQRSGTWSCVRYARKQKVPVVVFWPDGTVTEEIDSA